MFKTFFKKSLIIFFTLAISLSFFICTTNTVEAKEKSLKFFPTITIGTFITGNQVATGTGMDVSGSEEDSIDKITKEKITVFKSTLLPKYIRNLFDYGYTIASTLAIVMVAVGGVIWLTSAGNPQKIGQAKSYITSAIIGIVLLFGSYLILSTINADLVNLEGIEVQTLKEINYGCCQIMEGTDTYVQAFTDIKPNCEAAGGTFKENYSPDLDNAKCEANVCGIISYKKGEKTASSGVGGVGVDGAKMWQQKQMCIDTNSSIVTEIVKNMKTLDSHYKDVTPDSKINQTCADIADCAENKVNCINKDYGDKCSNMVGMSCYCYDGIPLLGEAGDGEPCGNNSQGLSTCVKTNRCEKEERRDRGGRPCEEGLRCCRPKN